MRQILVHYVWLALALALIAAIVSHLVYPFVLRIARVRHFYDNPDARKLQREPVPVLGGPVVFAGICVGTMIVLTLWFDTKPLIMLGGMAILMAVGMWDDKRGLNSLLRFGIEILVVVTLILVSGNMIDQFGGVFGLYQLPVAAAMPISIIAGVGIINAINLIDGVDGYSSGYIMLASILFSVLFTAARIYGLAFTCAIVAGALLPFFLHNVFGQKTKMFIGDGGTLMLGTLMTSLVFSVLRHQSMCYPWAQQHNIGLVAFCLAVLAIPVMDTLRVMTRRILHGTSPFHADKTHLHHLFVDMQFSHVGATLALLTIEILIMLSWLLAWLLGGSAMTQLLVVILVGGTLTCILYPFMRWHQRRDSALWQAACRLGRRTHIEGSAFWNWMQKAVDGDLFAEGKI